MCQVGQTARRDIHQLQQEKLELQGGYSREYKLQDKRQYMGEDRAINDEAGKTHSSKRSETNG